MTIKKRLTIVIGLIYLLTLIFHIVLQVNGGETNLENLRLLGIAMVLPLVVTIFAQIVLFKDPLFQKLGFSFKFNKWFLAAVLLPVSMALVKIAIFINLVNEVSTVAISFLTLLIVGITIASLSAFLEEIVWRGYLFHYTSNWGFYRSTVFTAIIWSMWHLPVALFYKYSFAPFIGTFLFLVHLFLLSILISIVRIKSKSVVPAAILHGMLNAMYLSNDLLGVGNELTMEGIQIGITLITVSVLLILTKPWKSYEENRFH